MSVSVIYSTFSVFDNSTWYFPCRRYLTSSRVFLIALIALLFLSYPYPISGGVTTNENGDFMVRTKYGRVSGLEIGFQSAKLRPVLAYLGLPYGSAKSARFMPPVSPRKLWKNLFTATQHGPACPQPLYTETELRARYPKQHAEHWITIQEFTRNQKEDCLSLNLYVPKRAQNATSLLPVMVFIHGDAYDAGTGNAYDGSVLASHGKIIVVTLNYRLGILGFLTTGTNNGVGNYALMDIVAALLWLKENVGHFGGDYRRVTLFGHGHGAAIVHFLMLSPVTKDGKLFQRGILMSGSALSPWAMAKDPVSCTRRVARKVNCSQFLDGTWSLITCFRNVSLADLIKAVPPSPKYFSCFTPTVGASSSVLPQSMEELMKAPSTIFSTSSLLFGLTRNEAFPYLNQTEVTNGITKLRKIQIARTFVHNIFEFQRQKVYEILDHHYTDWNRNVDMYSRRDSILDLLSDGLYVAPLLRVGEAHAKKRATYLYVFNYYRGEDSYKPWSGSVYGDELPFVFGAPLVGGISPFPGDYKKIDRPLSESMMTYWSNFVKTGDPSKPVPRTYYRLRNIVWPTFQPNNGSYLQIGPQSKVGINYRGRQMWLWLDLIPKLREEETDDSRDHLLRDSHNMTLFDAPGRLAAVDNIFPITTQKPMQTTSRSVTRNINITPEVRTLPGNTDPHNHPQNDDSATNASTGAISSDDNSVQVNVTIAVGFSLLLLNILIFAGIYYQRRKIKKLRESEIAADPEEAACLDTVGGESTEHDVMTAGPEAISLLSTAVSQTPLIHAEPKFLPSNKQLNDVSKSLPYSYTSSSSASSTYVPLHKLPTFSSSEPDVERKKVPTKSPIVLHDHNNITHSNDRQLPNNVQIPHNSSASPTTGNTHNNADSSTNGRTNIASTQPHVNKAPNNLYAQPHRPALNVKTKQKTSAAAGAKNDHSGTYV